MEAYDYAAKASTVKIDDIATDGFISALGCNGSILRWIKENDPKCVELCVSGVRLVTSWYCPEDSFRCPESARQLGWLGYFVGENTHLKELTFYYNHENQCFSNDAIKSFCKGLNINRSIQKFELDSMDLYGGEIFETLRPFFENNHNLSELVVKQCKFGDGCARHFAMALKDCSKSLKHIKLEGNEIRGGKLSEIIETLSMNPQLEVEES